MNSQLSAKFTLWCSRALFILICLLIFAMPGSTKACRTAWENIIAPQLDARTRPCNFHPHLKK